MSLDKGGVSFHLGISLAGFSHAEGLVSCMPTLNKGYSKDDGSEEEDIHLFF